MVNAKDTLAIVGFSSEACFPREGAEQLSERRPEQRMKQVSRARWASGGASRSWVKGGNRPNPTASRPANTSLDKCWGDQSSTVTAFFQNNCYPKKMQESQLNVDKPILSSPEKGYHPVKVALQPKRTHIWNQTRDTGPRLLPTCSPGGCRGACGTSQAGHRPEPGTHRLPSVR